MLRRLATALNRTAVAACAVGLLILSLSARTVGPANRVLAPIPASFFGMTLIGGQIWPAVPVGALGKGTGVNWPYTEPRKGEYHWDRLDAWVRLARLHGVDFFYSNDLVPPWAAADPKTCRPTYRGSPVMGCTSTVADLGDWDHFIAALAARYKGRMIYELWNEPETQSFSGTVAEMVELTAHEYRTIRAMDPGALILAPSGTSAYMDRYFAAGGPAGVDVVTFHSYRPIPEEIVEDARAMKSVAARYGLSAKPLWDTETSWGSTAPAADEQSGFVASLCLLLWSSGVSRVYWYAWDSPTFGSLWGRATGASPAASSYRQVYQWMVGATMDSPCEKDANSTWTCTLVRPGGARSLAVWNRAARATYTPPRGYDFYLDLTGEKHPIRGAIAVGYRPVSLVNER